MLGLVPIRCRGYEVSQAPGEVVYSDIPQGGGTELESTVQGH